MDQAPSIILGLCSYTHDSAAALLVDGQLVGFVEEERLSQKKHTKDYPRRAVEWLLGEVGLSATDVDAVAYNFQPARYLLEPPAALRLALSPTTRDRAIPRARSFAKVAMRTQLRVRDIGRRFPAARVSPVLHHRAHQLAAFAASGWNESAVLVVDSLGERQTTTIARGHDALRPRTRTLEAINDPASLGYVYGAVTEHLGWRRGDEEGTVMALAALGDPGGSGVRRVAVVPPRGVRDPVLLVGEAAVVLVAPCGARGVRHGPHPRLRTRALMSDFRSG